MPWNNQNGGGRNGGGRGPWGNGPSQAAVRRPILRNS